MGSSKETYALTVKCKKCDFQVSQEVQVEPQDLAKAKTEMTQQAASIHKKHSDLSNFECY